LMTYGWAILIIAIVLAILFKLGVFSGANLTGTSCLGAPGFSCSDPVLSATTGLLSFNFGQSTGSQIYNVVMTCAAVSDSAGYPYTGGSSTNWSLIATNGVAGTVVSGTLDTEPPSSSALVIANGQSLTISSLPCYSASGIASTSSTFSVGSTFQGSVWVGYATSPGGTMQTQKALTISAKAS
ncbi:MAG: hypothetical protein ACP5T6_03325, partial [Candidatus Micrarchaeia archaeon]